MESSCTMKHSWREGRRAVEYESSEADRDRHARQGREIERSVLSTIVRLMIALTHRQTALALALLFLSLASASLAQSISLSSPQGVISTALQAHNLSNQEAVKAHPVHLRGVVTYFDPDFGTGYAAVFLHDATGCVYLLPTVKQGAQLFVGALIDVQGITSPGGFGPIVVNPQIRVLGRAPLPLNPPRVSLAILKTGKEDAQWVEVEGSIHRVIEYAHSVTLRLEMLDGPVDVTMIKDPGANYAQLVDAQVRIHANAAPTINADEQMIGVHLMTPNLSTVEVIEPAPADPYARLPIPINRLLHWDQFSIASHPFARKRDSAMAWLHALHSRRDPRDLRADNPDNPHRCGRPG